MTFSSFIKNGKRFLPNSVEEAIPADHIQIVGNTVSWYDYDGLWYESTTEDAVEARIAQLVEDQVGYPVILKHKGDGNGHIAWEFQRKLDLNAAIDLLASDPFAPKP